MKKLTFILSACLLTASMSFADNKDASNATQDTFNYPVLGGKYSLTNKWLYSVKADNYVANKVGNKDFVRGMVAKDGKMYFIDRELKQLTVVDGTTGARLTPIALGSNVFTYDDNGETKVAGTLPFNDIKLDGAGNMLVGNCITSNAQPFQIWKIDMATGQGTLILQEILKNNPDFAASPIRFDAFGVYGDVTKNGVIMAANASAMEAYRWTITNGVVGAAEVIVFDTQTEGTYLTGKANPGSAPQIFPLDETMFYLDGNATLPTLIDEDGNILDGFYHNTAVINDEVTSPGNTFKLNDGHNGLIEFEMGGEYFFLVAAANTAGTPPSSFRLFKWKDANKSFADMTNLWTFPAVGMGAASNSYRTAVPSVEVNENTKIAKLYVYAGENGYGMYEFSSVSTGVNSLYNNDVLKVNVVDRSLNFNESVANVAIYSLTGQLVNQAQNVNSVKVLNSGVYLVKATTFAGETAVVKVIVK